MQSEVIARLKTIITDAEADIAQDYAEAETTGESPDLHDNEITLSLADAKALVAALSTDAEPVAFVVRNDLENGSGLFCDERSGIIQDHLGHWQNADVALYAEPVNTAPAVAVKADLPERFEEWWAGRDSKGEKTLDYNQRKQLAWDAFYAATLSAQVQDAAVPALKIGIYGKAYDRPDERRAYTYDEQPHNVEAYKLGRVCSEIHSGGDWIDRGLNLLKALQREGFGVFELPSSPASKHGDAE